MRIYITGASCAGVTTLGTTLALQAGLQHVDVDDFYWLPTDPPFTTKRLPADRVALIQQTLADDNWVLTGSFDGWGDALIATVDLIVFVITPTPVRLQRLAARERERFGARIDPGGDMHAIHVAFREWAAEYDNPAFISRNRARHDAWLNRQSAPVLRLDGTAPAEALATQVLRHRAASLTGAALPRHPRTNC